VVVMVMGNDDGVRRRAIVDCSQNGRSIARINDQRTPAGITQQPDVIVIKCGKCVQIHDSSGDGAWAFPQNHHHAAASP